jgi:hypothetical protein
MFITGALVLIWLNLFDRNYIFLFTVIFIFVFIIEIYIDFVSISTYLSLPSFHVNNHQLSHCPFKLLWSYITNKSLFIQQNRSLLLREHAFKISNIQLQNPFRRLMLSRIQNLFRQTISYPKNQSDHNKYSLFNYRCPICLNSEQYSFRWIALGCGHILCSLCTQHLYSGTKPICPNCRLPIILSDLTILYI